MPSADEADQSITPAVKLASAWEVKRRPRPPGSSWLLDPDLNLATVRYRDLLRRQRLISLAKRPADAPISSRKAFDNVQRKAVCMMAATNSDLTQEQLARLFNTNTTTISRTLQNREMWLKFDPQTKAKLTRKRRPIHTFLEFDISDWAEECMRDGVLITDSNLKAKAMEIAKKRDLLSLPQPFACSPKWMKNIKGRLGIVKGRIVNYKKTSLLPGRVLSEASTSELRTDSMSDPSEADRATFSAQPSVESTLVIHGVSESYTSPISPGSAHFLPHTASDAPFSATPLALASTGVGGMVNTVHAPPGTSHGIQSPPDLPVPAWLDFTLPVAAAGQYEASDELRINPAPDVGHGGACLPDTDASLLLTHRLPSDPTTFVPDMQASCPPLVSDGSVAPAPFSPPEYSVGVTPTNRVSTDIASFFGPFFDPSISSSSALSMDAASTFMPSVDLSAPLMPPREASSLLDPSLCVAQEDIDRLAAEMMHWPIEGLLGDTGVSPSQGQAFPPQDAMSFGGLMPSQELGISLDWLENPELLFAPN